MSGNADGKDRMDRRVRRTRNRLGDALWELLQEKELDAITVTEVLERAGVGRSTFYSHFSDKDDLFVSDINEFLEALATMLSGSEDPADRVAPVREFLSHAAKGRHFHDALAASDRLGDFWDLARAHFARTIEERLAELPRARRLPAGERPAVARALAGALVSLLDWWIDGETGLAPEEMDELYHRLVWRGLGTTRQRSPGRSRRKR